MVHFYSKVAFVSGVGLGVILAILCSYQLKLEERQYVPEKKSYRKWFSDKNLQRKLLSWDNIRYKNESHVSESKFLFDTIKVRCILLVKKENNAKAAKNTWLRGCNDVKLIHLKPKDKIILPKMSKKGDSSWILLCKTLNELNDFDWTFIANDYTFVIMENFRYYVAPLNANKEHYLGHAVKFWGTIYNDGQAGYALSKGTLKKFKALVDSKKCEETMYRNREDFYLGKYLNDLNITPLNTQDSEGLSTFHPYNWYQTFFIGGGYKTDVFKVKCCSNQAITFQAIEGDKMYTYYYLLYQLQIFNYGDLGNRPPVSISDEKIWKGFLKERNIHVNNVSAKQYYQIWEDYIEDPNSFAKNMRRELNLEFV